MRVAFDPISKRGFYVMRLETKCRIFVILA